uniref:Carboxypeptidase n=1 Tax=Kalanchoe fedtschenkoi TaxID=63787 RepID=A0A7N0TIF6_KALFE
MKMKMPRPWIPVALLLLYTCLAVESAAPHKISALPGQPEVSFQQYAGYITVDRQKQRALFYYFAEAETDPASKPIVLWLNGGPGCSSVGAGLFCEHGPFKPSGNALLKNDYSWNREANIIYLESPAGVGFSYSGDASFYSHTNDEMTAKDNLAFLRRWFLEFPQYENRDLFIAGESYAGHYVPQLAQLIVESKTKFNLKGIALGNPLLEFNTDFNSRAEYLWSHGLISDSTFVEFTKVCNFSQMRRQAGAQTFTPVCRGVWSKVSAEISRYINSYDVTSDVCLSTIESQSLVLNQLQALAKKVDVCVEDETIKYLNRDDVQRALHAKLKGVTSWTVCSDVLTYEKKDMELEMIPVLKTLVKSGIRVFVYSGDQDSVIPFIGTRTLVDGLGRELGLNTTVPYRVWFEGRQVYGDVLSYATIRGAAHEAPFSQPERSLVLFRTFLRAQPLPAATQL